MSFHIARWRPSISRAFSLSASLISLSVPSSPKDFTFTDCIAARSSLEASSFSVASFALITSSAFTNAILASSRRTRSALIPVLLDLSAIASEIASETWVFWSNSCPISEAL